MAHAKKLLTLPSLLSPMPKTVNGRARCQFNTLRQIRMALHHLSGQPMNYEVITSEAKVEGQYLYALHDGDHQLSAYLNREQFLRWFNDSYAQYVSLPAGS